MRPTVGSSGKLTWSERQALAKKRAEEEEVASRVAAAPAHSRHTPSVSSPGKWGAGAVGDAATAGNTSVSREPEPEVPSPPPPPPPPVVSRPSFAPEPQFEAEPEVDVPPPLPPPPPPPPPPAAQVHSLPWVQTMKLTY